ncbi:unnamed protein product [Trichogramma brassicae]|uniref:Aspartic peptidase DDI1-type domain-containing protein n=1 Tax=Trichogramma brassicae TaxID=86971 RepID=A0A6H5HVX0_9HYME|nr:unnamed protein product [Trichogramma brassicae]
MTETGGIADEDRALDDEDVENCELVYNEYEEEQEDDDAEVCVGSDEEEIAVAEVKDENEAQLSLDETASEAEYSKVSVERLVACHVARVVQEDTSSPKSLESNQRPCLLKQEDEREQLFLDVQGEATKQQPIDPPVEFADEAAEIAGLSNENRHLVKMCLGRQEYVALLDPGATVTAILPRVAEQFAEKITGKRG